MSEQKNQTVVEGMPERPTSFYYEDYNTATDPVYLCYARHVKVYADRMEALYRASEAKVTLLELKLAEVEKSRDDYMHLFNGAVAVGVELRSDGSISNPPLIVEQIARATAEAELAALKRCINDISGGAAQGLLAYGKYLKNAAPTVEKEGK